MLLQIDTSESKIIKLGLYKSVDEVNLINTDTTKGHLEDLLPAIDDLLKANGISKHDISAIVANVGPGTYTGLRIGITTANTLAKALDIPIYSFQSEISQEKLKEIFYTKDTKKFTGQILPVYANIL